MNDLATHLRNAATDWDGLPGHDDEEIIHYITCKKAREIADHIEAQENLIQDMDRIGCMLANVAYNLSQPSALLDARRKEILKEVGSEWDALKAKISLSKASKSNPNTPERNDE